MENRPRYRVPDELRETLLDFTIAYLLEKPANLPTFGLNFFQRLKDEREHRSGGTQITFAATAGSSSSGGGGSGSVPDNLNGEPGQEAEEGNRKEMDYILDEAITDWILQFSIVFMVERPKDIIEFAIRYCEKKVESATQKAKQAEEKAQAAASAD